VASKVLSSRKSWAVVSILEKNPYYPLIAAVDPLSDEALVHLKSYKYSSVDKSWVSNHILRHYVLSRSQYLPKEG
jgi:hypothetical protein